MRKLLLFALLPVAALFIFTGCCGVSNGCPAEKSNVITLPVPERAAGQTDVLQLALDPIPTVRVAFIGLGMRGPGAVERFMNIPGIEVVALCDVLEDRVKKCNSMLADKGFPAAQEFFGDTTVWREVVKLPNLDLVYICTPWSSHTPIAVEAMKNGKNAAIEVPAARSIADCWDLVNTAEQTRKHCIQLENCTYDEFEMATLNMAQQGVFGNVIHVEGAYIHDLRGLMFGKEGYWDMWRLKENTTRKGDVYPTHGLGPICQILNIHRGDKMNHLVSMATDQFGMTEYAKGVFGADSPEAKVDYQMGDNTTTLVRTEKGKTILVQHDVTSPRPYSRIHQVSGTKGFAQKWPIEGLAVESSMLSAELREKYPHLGTHDNVNPEAKSAILEYYKHPFYVEIGKKAKEVGGHGGMDFVMDYRLVYCLRNGLPLDMDVYDAAEWSSIAELSEISINNDSAPVEVPDFTRGAWNKVQGLKFAQ